MNKPHILLPLAVAGLVLTAAFTTAALVNAAEDPLKVVTDTGFRPAEVKALFDVAPMSVSMRAKLVTADATLQRAEVKALFDVAPMSVSMRAKLVMADATLQQAEVKALFDVAPRCVPKPTGAGKMR